MKSWTPTNDRQLWHTVNDSGRIWPLYATPCSDGYFVELALPVSTKEQWAHVSRWLNDQAFYSDGTHWLIRKTVFEQSQRKCDGVTPSYYLRWPNFESSDNRQPESDNRQVEDQSNDTQNELLAFTKFFCADNGWPDVSKRHVEFAYVLKSALKWLLEKRKPLPLGFCTVYALPLRGNFATILWHQFPNIGTTLKRRKLRMGILEGVGVIKSLHNPELLDVKDGAFNWSLHVVEEKKFQQVAERIERQTLESSTPNRYLLRLGRLIKNSYAQIIDCLAAYYAKENTACGRVDSSDGIGRSRLLQTPSRFRNRITRQKGVPNVVVDDPVETAKDAP